MKDSLSLQEYVSPKLCIMHVSVEKVFVASVSAGAEHEEYEAVDLFD